MKTKKALEITAYIDGASRGNPGPAAIGVVFQDGQGRAVKQISQRIGNATNNTAEYVGLVFALQEALLLRAEKLRIFTDSELLAKQFNGEYRTKDARLKLFLLLAGHLRQGFKDVTVSHVPREANKLADREANKALDEDIFL